MAPPAPARTWRDNPFVRSWGGVIGLGVLVTMLAACLLTVPWTFGEGASGSPRYDEQTRTARQLPPFWAPWPEDSGGEGPRARAESTARVIAQSREREARGLAADAPVEVTPAQVQAAWPRYWLGTDLLGRSVLIRTLAGGGLSLMIGIAAAVIAIGIGTLYGAIAGYVGGRTDAVMMRVVDVLYGLPYILLVVLVAVAIDAVIDSWQVGVSAEATQRRAALVAAEMAGFTGTEAERGAAEEAARTRALVAVGSGEVAAWKKQTLGVVTLLVAIGGVSWLTMARVVRGQVLSLKNQPFMEAARAMGVGVRGQFVRHLLPNLVGPIVVYATLTVPQAILQESFLSFLGIGVKSPLPSWGNLAADGLSELNPYRSHWWLLLFPCLMLGVTLLALNFVGEGLREALDPKRSRR